MLTLHLRNTTHLRIRPGDVTRWVNAAARALECPTGELSIFFCGDARCIRTNRAWFGRSRTTDVMAFPLHEDGYWGDILINLRQTRRQARRFGIPFEEEVRRLVIHGLLHLHGYDHTSDQGEMEALQEGLMGLKAARRTASGLRKPSRVPKNSSRVPARRGALKKASKATRSSHRP